MEKIIWNESFSVGIPLLDSQHMELIRMINKLIGAKDVRVNSEAISDTLLNMTNYAIFHFKTEEDYLREHGYHIKKNIPVSENKPLPSVQILWLIKILFQMRSLLF